VVAEARHEVGDRVEPLPDAGDRAAAAAERRVERAVGLVADECERAGSSASALATPPATIVPSARTMTSNACERPAPTAVVTMPPWPKSVSSPPSLV
jgi:hypothetical protein